MIWVQRLRTASELHFFVNLMLSCGVLLSQTHTKCFSSPIENSCAVHRAQHAHSACTCTPSGSSEDGRTPMHVSCRRTHARVHAAQLAHSACTCTASGSSEDGRVCRATGQRRPSRKLQRAKSQVATHQGPDQQRPSRMLGRTRVSKTRPQNGGHQTVPKPGRTARVTARGVTLKLRICWYHGAVQLLGPPRKAITPPFFEHVAAAQPFCWRRASLRFQQHAAKQPSLRSRRRSSQAQPSTAQPSSPAQSSDLEAPCQVILHVHVQSPRASRRTHACAHLCKCRAGVIH